VKMWKNLSAQQRAWPRGADAKLCAHVRCKPDPFGLPTMDELKDVRRQVGHYEADRAKAAQQPLPAGQEQTELVWAHDSNDEEVEETGREVAGHVEDSDESGEDEAAAHDDDNEEEKDDDHTGRMRGGRRTMTRWMGRRMRRL